jgi:hypothetical protein
MFPALWHLCTSRNRHGLRARYRRKNDGPLRGRQADPKDRRGYSQYNQSPSEYVPRSGMATVIAYVDGFNLYHGLHQAYGRRYLWLNLEHLVQRVRPSDQILGVRYFTAEVRDDPYGLARHRAYLAALKAHCPTVDVVLGRYQTKTMTCRQCRSTCRFPTAAQFVRDPFANSQAVHTGRS